MTELEELKVRVEQLEENQKTTCELIERILSILEKFE